jgi:hypothetical protein
MAEDQRKDELILALTEMVQELTSKIVNLRVEAGLQLKKQSKELEELKNKPKLKAVENE